MHCLIVADQTFEREIDNKTTALHKAAREGNGPLVRRLLSHPEVNVNSQDKYNGQTALWLAADKGHTDVIALLLSHSGLNPNIKSDDQQTALFRASDNGHSSVVELLLSHPNIDAEVICRNGKTALQLAEEKHEFTIVALLRKLHASHKYTPQQRAVVKGLQTKAFVQAAKDGEVGIVLNFLQQGVDVNALKSGWPALFHASNEGNTAVVRLLLQQPDLVVNWCDPDGRTALHAAAHHGREEVMRLLLNDERTDVNARDGGGKTALHTATYNGRIEVVQILLAHRGIDFNSPDYTGRTPLQVSEALGYPTDMLRAAVEKADLNAREIASLKAAVSKAEQDRKDAIAAKKADDDAIVQAANAGNLTVVRDMLRRGSDCNGRSKLARTSLHVAAEKGHIDMVRLMISHPSLQINLQDMYGWTALHLATFHHHRDIVLLLLAAGIDTHIKDRNRKTALEMASEQGNLADMANILRDPAASLVAMKEGRLPRLSNSRKSSRRIKSSNGRIVCIPK